MILDTIKAQASGILLGVAFISGLSAGWFAASYLDAIKAEKVAAIALEDKLELDKAVIAKQQELIEFNNAETARRLKAEEGEQNAKDILDRIMHDADKRSGVRVVPVERICRGGLPESDAPASSVSPASTIFERYDASLAELERLTKQAVRACEIDREDVIRQAGGR